MILRTAIISFLGFLTAPLAAQGEPVASSAGTPYPALEVLEAFRNGCGTIDNQKAASASLSAAEWEPVANDALPEKFREFLSAAKEAGSIIATSEDGSISDAEVFEKTVAGERVFVVLSEIRVGGMRVSGCRLFDLGETRQIGHQLATDWLDREPVRTVEREEISVAEWEPGLLPGHDSFQLFFIPPNSPAKQALKFDGIALKSDTVGVSE